METLSGTELKLAVRLECDGLTMDQFGFRCEFFTSPSKVVTVEKSSMVRESEQCYVAVVDTAGMASGQIKMKVVASVPDADCNDGIRTERVLTETGVMIKKG